VNEVRYLFGEFTKIRVTTTVSFTSDWVINAKTEQIRPEFLRLLSQTNSQQITPHLYSNVYCVCIGDADTVLLMTLLLFIGVRTIPILIVIMNIFMYQISINKNAQTLYTANRPEKGQFRAASFASRSPMSKWVRLSVTLFSCVECKINMIILRPAELQLVEQMSFQLFSKQLR